MSEYGYRPRTIMVPLIAVFAMSLCLWVCLWLAVRARDGGKKIHESFYAEADEKAEADTSKVDKREKGPDAKDEKVGGGRKIPQGAEKLSETRPELTSVHREHTNDHLIDLVDTNDPALGKCVMVDGKVQFCERDEHIYHEMLVHFPATYVKKLERVIICGGGDCNALREVLKYPSVTEVIVMEKDERLVSIMETHLMTESHRDDARVRWMFGDPAKSMTRLFNAAEKKGDMGGYQMVVVDTKERGGMAAVYGSAFYKQVRALLAPAGVLVRNGGSNQALLAGEFSHTLVYSFNSPAQHVQYTMVIAADFVLEAHVIDVTAMSRQRVHSRFYKPQAHFSHVPWFVGTKVRAHA